MGGGHWGFFWPTKILFPCLFACLLVYKICIQPFAREEKKRRGSKQNKTTKITITWLFQQQGNTVEDAIETNNTGS